MNIRVYRGDGDIQADTITSPLISEIHVALQRGRVELDIGSNWTPVQQQTIFIPDAFVGDVAQSFDRLNGAAWKGVVTSVHHGLTENSELITEQGILREPS